MGQFHYDQGSFHVFVFSVASIYIFYEIGHKSSWFCRNNNFTMSKIHRDFYRVIYKVQFKGSDKTLLKLANHAKVDGLFDLTAAPFTNHPVKFLYLHLN